ncbi:MAG: hypothetical protein A2Y76_00160 [Planctomycetes bacterium RBG_13_60_9]|nr:MAG: hypothetical protein A2Y76_00160 [Planctomycetes bacterium RBG_13_60_9]
MTEVCFEATEIEIGFHPDGYRIDKTASPMNRYTKWDVLSGSRWVNPRSVCFDSLPSSGWIKKDRFDWDRRSMESIG